MAVKGLNTVKQLVAELKLNHARDPHQNQRVNEVNGTGHNKW